MGHHIDYQETRTTLGASQLTPLITNKHRRGAKRRLEDAFNRMQELEENDLLQLTPSPMKELEENYLLQLTQSLLASAGSL